MRPHRINIIGASGVGKSTMGAALATRLGVPHVDSDAYYHLPTDPPYRVQRSPEERRELLERDLAPHEGWVLTGGAGTWSPAPRLDFTLVVFLYLPRAVRLARILHREQTLYGARIEAGGDMASDHREFMEWTARYDDGTAEGTNTLPIHEAYLRRVTCPVLRLTDPLSTDEAISRVVAVLQGDGPQAVG
jgi:adenylate kinase family enzyme